MENIRTVLAYHQTKCYSGAPPSHVGNFVIGYTALSIGILVQGQLYCKPKILFEGLTVLLLV